MATTTALTPATPQSARPAAPTPPTTGTWTHPRMKEINRRREANVLTNTRVLHAAIFTVVFLSTFFAPGRWFHAALSIVPLPANIEALSLHALRILLILATSNRMRPWWAAEDQMEDIPLTPSQRKLLGLTPSSSTPLPSAAGNGTYVTPPRYARSTPRSDSSRAAVAGSSPLGGSVGGTPFGGSPLARKAMEGRRSSYGSPLGNSLFDDAGGSSNRGSPGSAFGDSTTMSPSGRGASVALNSKWLYQRGKSRPSFGL